MAGLSCVSPPEPQLHKRKRGLFSCDRCKTRKIACHRINGNSIYEPCKGCSALSLECKTTMERKRRRLTDDTVKTNNEYMTKILQVIYPNVDASSTSSLKDCYEQLKVKKASPISEPESHTTQELNCPSGSTGGRCITATTPESEDDLTSEDEKFEVIYSGKSIDGIVSTSSTFGENYASFDRVIYDNDGISHYMGSFGFTNLLTKLLNDFIRLTKKKDNNSIKFVQSMNQRGSIISSFSETTDLKNLDTSLFPLVCYLSKEEAAFYVSKYSQAYNGLLSGINQERFQKIYDKFWKINAGLLPTTSLTYAQYCCIYAVWINGISVELHPQAKMRETYDIMNKYINLIKVILSDVFLSHSLDGISSLLLLSFFFERNMQIETAYILCQTAVCHAMSCGFHRESIANNETSYLWWSLFNREIKLGLYFGRSSTIPLKQVNLKYEQRFNESLDFNSKFNLLQTELNKLIYTLLCNRTKLRSSGRNLNRKHIQAALKMDTRFSNFFDKLPLKVQKFQYLQANEAELLINYYCAKLSSTLPFILFPIETVTDKMGSILSLIESCMKACVEYVELVMVVDNFTFVQLNYDEALTSSYCMLAFVSGALFYKISCNALPEPPANAEEHIKNIQKYSRLLKMSSEKKIATARGTMRVRRYWTQVLYEDLEFLYSNVEGNEATIRELRKTILDDECIIYSCPQTVMVSSLLHNNQFFIDELSPSSE